MYSEYAENQLKEMTNLKKVNENKFKFISSKLNNILQRSIK